MIYELIFSLIASGKYTHWIDWTEAGDGVLIPDLKAVSTARQLTVDWQEVTLIEVCCARFVQPLERYRLS